MDLFDHSLNVKLFSGTFLFKHQTSDVWKIDHLPYHDTYISCYGNFENLPRANNLATYIAIPEGNADFVHRSVFQFFFCLQKMMCYKNITCNIKNSIIYY
jgi:hypothetical protein